MTLDHEIGIYVHDGTVTAAHLRGRHGEGKPTSLFGRSWRVTKIHKADGGLLVVILRPLEVEGPVMCNRCGSFEILKIDGLDRCTECASVNLVPRREAAAVGAGRDPR